MKHRIKQVIDGLGITQRQLAEKTGLTEVGISKMVNSGTATRNSLEKIAGALNLHLEDIAVKEKVLKAKYGSDKTPLRLGNLELPCYVLENGMRVFSGRGIQKALGVTDTSGVWLSKFIKTEPIKTYLSEIITGDTTVFERMSNPLIFERAGAGGSQSDTYGYEATNLIDLCDAIIKCGENGYDMPLQYIANSNIIIRAVAKTGIIALVDEATGYDKEKSRAKDELQKILQLYLVEEAAKWVKQFNDQFFEDIYKMRHWTWGNTSKRPGVVGTWIKDIVYDRLAPILPELERLNPKNENGNRTHKHHQFLSEDVGLPRLKQHLEAVHAIAVVANYDWDTFNRYLDKAYPRKYTELYLDFGDNQ